MANVNEISEHVRGFLSGKVPLEDFENWSAEYSWNIHKRADIRTQQLAYLVHSKIEEFGEGALDEASFREELASAVHAFEVTPVLS